MIHIDRGGDLPGTRYFFDNCRRARRRVRRDRPVVLSLVARQLARSARQSRLHGREYKKDIILVEVAYNWRPAEYRNNPAPFPETPEGQRQFLDEVNRIVLNTPHHRGKGIFWWEPAVPGGPIASRGMFDADNNALPVITVFDRFTRGKTPERAGDLGE